MRTMKQIMLAVALIFTLGVNAASAAPTDHPGVMANPPNMSFDHTAVVPEGWVMITRTVIVRLGPSWNWYENNAHGSSGIVNVSIDGTTRELIVETDFDASAGEKILYAGASPDATLVQKGVSAGASGGSNITRYTIVSSKALSGGYAAYLPIRPNGSCFDSDVDNLWITQISMKPVPAQG